MWTIDLPTSVMVEGKKKKTKVYLNLNAYRNWHHRTQHSTKVLFAKLVKPLVQHIPRQEMVHLHYVLWAPTEARRDLMNVIAVVDKYFSDVLSDSDALDDDSTKFIVSTSTAYGGVDKNNPRVSVTIVPVDSPMELNFQ